MRRVEAEWTDFFNKNEKKYAAMKNDGTEGARTIILKVFWWHLLEKSRDIYERFVLFADFQHRFDMKLTERKYEWNLSLQS